MERNGMKVRSRKTPGINDRQVVLAEMKVKQEKRNEKQKSNTKSTGAADASLFNTTPKRVESSDAIEMLRCDRKARILNVLPRVRGNSMRTSRIVLQRIPSTGSKPLMLHFNSPRGCFGHHLCLDGMDITDRQGTILGAVAGRAEARGVCFRVGGADNIECVCTSAWGAVCVEVGHLPCGRGRAAV